MYLSFDSYLPKGLRYQINARTPDSKLLNPEYATKLRSGIQIIGRLTRRNANGEEKKSQANRIICLPNPIIHQEGFFITNLNFFKVLAQYFKKVQIVPLDQFFKDFIFPIVQTSILKNWSVYSQPQKPLQDVGFTEMPEKIEGGEALVGIWVDFTFFILKVIGSEEKSNFDDLKNKFLYQTFSFYQTFILLRMVDRLYGWYKNLQKNLNAPTYLSYKSKIKLLRSNFLLKKAYLQFGEVYQNLVEDLKQIKIKDPEEFYKKGVCFTKLFLNKKKV